MDFVKHVGPSRVVRTFHDLGRVLSRGLGRPACAFGGNVLAVETAFIATGASRFLFGAPDLGGGASIAAVAQLGRSRSGG